ncbi:hypothetical protein AK812_SmicGene26241 [Symbiodinium microadriaticum]|uniref:Uncharacterized protein n=1 Tax=Symbiodinium microadriaticum TaxID=2951 RepID=A0A1Q9DA27_SYMMI|nr:hypothetical protein AK812_SmicGene26241 [Symbiodinium microadriaticum]
MSAQPSVPTPPALEGEETGPNYGQAHQGAREQAAVEDRGERQALQTQPQLNGVDPRRGDVVREGPPRAEPRITGPPDEGRIQAEPRLGNGQRVNGSTDEVPPALPLADQTTALSPGSSAGYESIPTRVSSPVRREYLPRDEEPHRAERTVAMEYSFQQAAGQPAVRWADTTTAYFNCGDTVTNRATNAVASATSTTSASGWITLVASGWLDLGGLKEKLHFYTALQALHLRRKFRQKYSGNSETTLSDMMERLSA